MEVYKSETREILRRLRAGQLSIPESTAALDAAVSGLIPRLTCEQILPLRAILLENNATVISERARRLQHG